MSLATFATALFRRSKKPRRVQRPRFRPQVEGLEERAVPASLQFEWIGGVGINPKDYGTAINWDTWSGSSWILASRIPTTGDSIQFGQPRSTALLYSANPFWSLT